MIPVSEPFLGQSEINNVLECVRSGWVSSSGSFLQKFERQWAEYCGRRFGIAVSNGTAALQLAVLALDLKPDDEVILPTFTIISCATAIVYSGAIPVLVDSDPKTWCMDVDQVRDRITSKTKAILPVHIYGHPVNMDPLLDIAENNGLMIVEDAAEAHGAEYSSKRSGDVRWIRCGSFGEMSCFSFYANKLITTGEGGMILTDDSVLAEKLRSLSNLCFKPARRFYHEDLGFNYRLTNLQAALGLSQIQRMEEIIQKKRSIAASYAERLKDIEGLQLPCEENWAHSVYWMYGIVLSDSISMSAPEFADALRKRGIETRPFFLGMHEQPVFHRRGLFSGEKYPVAEKLARRGLYLPSGLGLKEDQITTVCDAIHSLIK
ncbi:DegT/DnrJ/EryC1/StrS family aminotransferase [bacterium]|nr:DegT/DnrJ/EryC1/StrS family aminotransferase [bacterium]